MDASLVHVHVHDGAELLRGKCRPIARTAIAGTVSRTGQSHGMQHGLMSWYLDERR